MSPRRARALKDRPGEDPAAALREHLIDTAEQLLARRHVSTITTRDIARSAGVSDGVLYNYFADKNDLILAALLRRYTRLTRRFDLDLPAAGTGTVIENLGSFARAGLAFQTDVLPLIAGILTEPVLLQRLIGEIHRRHFGADQSPQHLVAYLQAEQALGRVRAGADPAAIATLLMGANMLLALTRLFVPDHTPPRDEELPLIVETLVRGLTPDAAPR